VTNVNDIVAAVLETAQLFGTKLTKAQALSYTRMLLPLGMEAALDTVRSIPSRHRAWPGPQHVLAVARAQARADAQRDHEETVKTRRNTPQHLPASNRYEQLARKWEAETVLDTEAGKERFAKIQSMLDEDME